MRALADLDKGETGKVVEFCAGWSFARRMTELGFDKGSKIRVISKGVPGPFIVEVKGCARVAIGWGEAQKIMVETGN